MDNSISTRGILFSMITEKWNIVGMFGVLTTALSTFLVDHYSEIVGIVSGSFGVILAILAIYKKLIEIKQERQKLINIRAQNKSYINSQKSNKNE